MDRPDDKIVDADLRSFVEHGGLDDRASVIVELSQTPTVRPGESSSGWFENTGYRVPIEALEGFDDEGSGMDELEKALQGLDLAATPVRLDSAQAFVLQVTPDQLKAIADMELVGPIRPNRRHYASR
jgi:hypothetical protein